MLLRGERMSCETIDSSSSNWLIVLLRSAASREAFSMAARRAEAKDQMPKASSKNKTCNTRLSLKLTPGKLGDNPCARSTPISISPMLTSRDLFHRKQKQRRLRQAVGSIENHCAPQ